MQTSGLIRDFTVRLSVYRMACDLQGTRAFSSMSAAFVICIMTIRLVLLDV